MQWEYLTKHSYSSLRDLNELGEQGWELVTIAVENRGLTCFLKREIERKREALTTPMTTENAEPVKTKPTSFTPAEPITPEKPPEPTKEYTSWALWKLLVVDHKSKTKAEKLRRQAICNLVDLELLEKHP